MPSFEAPVHADAAATPPARRRLAWASLWFGLAGLIAANVPLAFFGEPPLWMAWIAPDSVPKPPDEPKPNWSFRVGPFQFGRGDESTGRGANDDVDAQHEREVRDYERRQFSIRLARGGAIALGAVGVALGLAAWQQARAGRLARGGVIASTLALTWDFVLLGVAVAVVIMILANFG